MLVLIATQLVGTATFRPYVIGFLVLFLIAATRDLGTRRTVLYLGWALGIALVAELASTRVGFPFGLYHYTGDTRGLELFVSNVPFFSPLSFPFLAYGSFCLARLVLPPPWATSPGGRVRMVLLAGVLMALLDVVIDPLAVLGDRWFLGRVFYYPAGGVYFGVPLSNFIGWLLVGWAMVGGLVATGQSGAGSPLLGVVIYGLVLIFNLSMTFWIGEWGLAGVGIVVHLMTFLLLYTVSRAVVGRDSGRLRDVRRGSGVLTGEGRRT